MLVEGRWYTTAEQRKLEGQSIPAAKIWRGFVTLDGSPGPDGRSFPAAKGRYHLIGSYGCPFALRTMHVRSEAGLEDLVTCDVAEGVLTDNGWAFKGHAGEDTPGATDDRLYGSKYLRELYVRADPKYTGRVTVPVLWDTETRTIVSNESAAIMAMFQGPFSAFAKGQ